MGEYNYEECPQGLRSIKNERNINYDFLNCLVEDFLSKNKTMRILEIGSGGGRNLFVLKKVFGDQLKLYGTDISDTAISYAKLQKIGHFTVSSSEKIPFGENFDLILIIDLLEHLPSKKKVEETIAVAIEKCKTNGYIYISAPIELNKFSLTWFFDKISFTKKLTNKIFGHTIQFTPNSMLNIFEKKQIKIKRIFYSVRTINQLQVLLFLYAPKIFLEKIFGPKQSKNLRDSNEIISVNNQLGLLFSLKKILFLTSRPFAFFGYHESYWLRNSRFAAGNIHILIERK